jgi:hypothetical protein
MAGCSHSVKPSEGLNANCPTGSVASCSGSSPPCPPPEPWFKNILDKLCPDDKALLDNLRKKGVQVSGYDRITMDAPYYDGTQWTTRRMNAAGMHYGNNIDLITTRPPAEMASTLYHEGIHAGQPDTMTLNEKEYEAFTKTEAWRIQKGLPPKMQRTTDSDGNTVPDTAAIRKYVDEKYPNKYVPSATGGAPDQVVGRDPATGQTILERADGTQYQRAPEKGDTYQVEPTWEPPQPGRKVQNCQLKCP